MNSKITKRGLAVHYNLNQTEETQAYSSLLINGGQNNKGGNPCLTNVFRQETLRDEVYRVPQFT